LPYYENIDFSLVVCKYENYARLLNLLNLNTEICSGGKKFGWENKRVGVYVKRKDEKVTVRSLKHSVGKGMEVTTLSKNDETDKRAGVRDGSSRKMGKSKWVAKFDEESVEEHAYIQGSPD